MKSKQLLTLAALLLICSSCSKNAATPEQVESVSLLSTQGLTAQIEQAEFDTAQFETVKEKFLDEALSLQLTDEADSSSMASHAEKLEQVITSVRGKNRLQVLCHLYSLGNCARLHTESLDSAKMLVPRMGQSYSREDVLKYVLMDRILLGTISKIVDVNEFMNSEQVVNFIRLRLNNLVVRGGVTQNTLGLGLSLYNSFLTTMTSKNIFYGLEPFVSNVAIKSLKPFVDSKSILEKYIEYIANNFNDLNEEQINANNLALFEAFLEVNRSNDLDRNLDSLFFLPESKLKTSDGVQKYMSFFDNLIYKNTKEGFTNDTLLTRILSLPFISVLSVAEVTALNSDFSFAVRDFESGSKLDEYRKNLYKFLKVKRDTYLNGSDYETFKLSLSTAINQYYGTSYTPTQIFSYRTHESASLFAGERPDEDNLLQAELGQNIIKPGVYGYENSDLSLTFSAPIVIAHPLSLISSNGKKIKIAAEKVLGLNLNSSLMQSNEHFISAQDYNRSELQPFLPYQKNTVVAIDSRDQGEDFKKACNQYIDGDRYNGQMAYVIGFKRFEIGNADLVEEIKKPSKELNGGDGKNAGEIEISAKLIFPSIMAKGEDGHNGLSNDLLYFEADNKISLSKSFTVGYEAQCQISECIFIPDDVTSSGCREVGVQIATNVRQVEIKIGTLAPGKGGKGGNGAVIKFTHVPERSLLVVDAGKGGKAGGNAAEQQRLGLGVLEEPSYFPALSLITAQGASGEQGQIVVHD